MKNLSSWYAFMRFQESWYANMGLMYAQDVGVEQELEWKKANFDRI